MYWEFANRLKKLPPYLFVEIDNMKREARRKDMDLINLGIGDPDFETPEPIVNEMKKAISDPENQHYPLGEGLIEFRKAAAIWCRKRFNINLDPEDEILALIGSKEGLGHVPMAFINPGDVVLVPNPAYPVYNSATIFAEGIPYMMPLFAENDWLPDLSKVPQSILKKTKMMFLNYPNNPTSAIANKNFFGEVVRFAKKYNIIICHDAAYSEIYFDNKKPVSFLEISGAKDVAIEFHSLSKTFNMTGWRIGFAVGNKNLIKGLAKVKSNLDSGVFHAIQKASIVALNLPQKITDDIRKIYEDRRNFFANELQKIGWKVQKSSASFYFWIKIPDKYGSSSTSFAKLLLEKYGIVATPGVGFGKYGEGYIRMTITAEKARLKEAVNRLRGLGDCPRFTERSSSGTRQ